MWLCNTCRRVPYKAAKSAKYWPGLPLADRRRKLLAVWQDIVHALGQTVEGITLPLISPVSVGRAGALKALEDGIDALICTIAGISYLTSTAKPYGDRESAIWLPAGCKTYARQPDRYYAIAPLSTLGTTAAY
jgi:predicted RNase H-like nuclease